MWDKLAFNQKWPSVCVDAHKLYSAHFRIIPVTVLTPAERSWVEKLDYPILRIKKEVVCLMCSTKRGALH